MNRGAAMSEYVPPNATPKQTEIINILSDGYKHPRIAFKDIFPFALDDDSFINTFKQQVFRLRMLLRPMALDIVASQDKTGKWHYQLVRLIGNPYS